DLSAIGIPTKALLFNDSDPDQDATVTGTSGAVGGTIINGLPSNIVFEPDTELSVVNANFNSNSNSFTYVDNVFGGTGSDANGVRANNRLELSLGGNNDDDRTNMNGAFRREFTLTADATVTITFMYLASVSNRADDGDDVHVLASIDGDRLGTNDIIDRAEGG